MNTKDNRKIQTVLLMAAGMGTRIRPLSENTPKPLIPVRGVPMIESLLQAVIQAGIDEIFITVGYKKEKYLYLADKYPGISFVENTDYQCKNTISSFYHAMRYLEGKNCLVCESDLYIADKSVIAGYMDKSRYLIREVERQNYEWGFIHRRGKISKVVRPKPEVFLDHHMYGVAYWMKDDLAKLISQVEKVYNDTDVSQFAYDEVANQIFDEIDMGMIRVSDNQLFEIDSIDDLIKVDASYEIVKDRG